MNNVVEGWRTCDICHYTRKEESFCMTGFLDVCDKHRDLVGTLARAFADCVEEQKKQDATENAALRAQLAAMREKADCGHPMAFQVRTKLGFDETHCIECERDGLRTQLQAAREALIVASQYLPDSRNGQDWEWCWNELNGESQDAVKAAREKIDAALAEVKAALEKVGGGLKWR